MCSGPLAGMDAALSTLQMPPGIPVGAMAIGGAKNAAIYAAQIIALCDDGLAEKLAAFKKDMASQVAKKDADLQSKI